MDNKIEYLKQTEFKEKFAKKIKERMAALSIDAFELSYRTKINMCSIYNYLSCKSQPNVYNFYKICKALHIKQSNFADVFFN